MWFLRFLTAENITKKVMIFSFCSNEIQSHDVTHVTQMTWHKQCKWCCAHKANDVCIRDILLRSLSIYCSYNWIFHRNDAVLTWLIYQEIWKESRHLKCQKILNCNLRTYIFYIRHTLKEDYQYKWRCRILHKNSYCSV